MLPRYWWIASAMRGCGCRVQDAGQAKLNFTLFSSEWHDSCPDSGWSIDSIRGFISTSIVRKHNDQCLVQCVDSNEMWLSVQRQGSGAEGRCA